jgi:glycosyltransferase involved in cell wall biosynthesis
LNSIDVLLPFHKVDKFLFEAIDSVAQSLYVDTRLILIDDRIDQSFHLKLNNFGLKNVEYISTGGGSGYGRALEVGSLCIQNKFVGLMNSDDLISPLRFHKQILALQNSEVSFSRLASINFRGKSISGLGGELRNTSYNPFFLLFGSYGANASMTFHKEWWSRFSFFDDKSALDWRIGIKSFHKSKIGFLNEDLYYYRKHKSQYTKSPDSIAKLQPLYNSWREHADAFGFSNLHWLHFHVLALSSESPLETDWEEISKFLEEVLEFSATLPYDQSVFLNKLIARRILAALRKPQNFRNISKVLNYLDASECIVMCMEFLSNASKSAFKR